VANHVYIILSYVTYVLLAVITSALLFGVGAVVMMVEESIRFVRTHEARHEIVRHHPNST